MIGEIKKAIETINSAGFFVDEEAFKFLRTLEKEGNIDILVKNSIIAAELQEPKPLFLERAFLERIAREKLIKKKDDRVKVSPVKRAPPIAKEFESNINVLSDPSDKIGIKGDLDDFYNYFKNRFEKLSKILRERLDVKDAGTIAGALKAKPNTKVKFIAMISDKRERGGRIFFRVEDFENSASVLALREGTYYEKAQKVILDQVVCFEVVKGRRDLFIVKDIIYPDIPEKKIDLKPIPFSTLLISDIHFGSKTFLDKVFQRMILWITGKIGSAKQVEKAGTIKYIIITGDIVDGIGVYPSQEDELQIPDIYNQYEGISKYIEEIPDYIEVILIPGNHDAVRQALPQPALSKEFAEPIFETRNIISLGNPSRISINEREFLLYHGTSLNDVISTTGLRIDNPENGMKHLIKMRHLAPIYGKATPLSPEKNDFLIIDQPPHVFQAGHIHVEGHCRHRGTLIISCGAWQSQTQYQRKLGLNPTTGVASMVGLGDLEMRIIDFKYPL